MPSVSKKQARFMAAASHNPKFAKRAGIKQSVARDFNRADAGTGILKKRVKKAEGGPARKPNIRPFTREEWEANLLPSLPGERETDVDPRVAEEREAISAMQWLQNQPVKYDQILRDKLGAQLTERERDFILKKASGGLANARTHAPYTRVSKAIVPVPVNRPFTTVNPGRDYFFDERTSRDYPTAPAVEMVTGDSLRGLMGRMARRPQRLAEGGLPDPGKDGLENLKALAKKFYEALELGDEDLANNLRMQIALIERGSGG